MRKGEQRNVTAERLGLEELCFNKEDETRVQHLLGHTPRKLVTFLVGWYKVIREARGFRLCQQDSDQGTKAQWQTKAALM